MANPLTGDFDAVLQVAVRQVNGLLATLHQSGAAEDAPIRLLHSARLEVGVPRRPRPDVDAFGDWVVAYRLARPPAPGDDVRGQLTGTAPPGAARLMDAVFDRFDEAFVPEDPEVARGRALAQVSTVTISLPEGSTSEVTIHVHVRARYAPAPGTTDLPAPIHGELQATFDIRVVGSPAGRRLHVRPSAQDSKIQFIPAPGSGLSAGDVARISTQVRKLLREGLELLPVDVPPDFPFTGFKGLGTGAGQVLALPLSLSGSGPPTGGLQGVTQSFIGTSGFALAVRKEYVLSLIDVEAIREAIRRRSITIGVDLLVGSVTATYRFRFSSGPTLTFRAGDIQIEGRVEVDTDTWGAPDGHVTFKQAIALVLDAATQRVSLQRVGEPDVDESWFIPHGRAVNIVRSEMDSALAANAGPVRRVFDDARQDVARGLRTFESSVTVTYTAVAITPDGVIVHGEIGSATVLITPDGGIVHGGIGGTRRTAAVVHVAETDDGAAFTAFESWIPGGRIERLVWSWVEYSDRFHTPWSGVSKSLVDEHRFILPKPPGVTALSHICLRVEGTRILSNGQTESVAGGTTCHVPEPEVVMDVPSWWEPVTVPVWLPDIAESARLKDAIAGHVAVQPSSPKGDGPTHNTLVYFADRRADRPLEALGRALARMRGRRGSLGVIVVLPAGAFDRPRRELDAALGALGERLPVPVQLTEDDEGGWTRTFAPTATPALYLLNARREFVWKHEGAIDPTVVSAALDRHVTAAPMPRPGPLRLAVARGARAPDAVFRDDAGQPFALHRLRGRLVLLTFWQSWSAPCLRELQRLQALQDTEGPDRPFVVAFHGGKEGRALDEIRRRLGLSFALVQDYEQRIARAYGVRCWPTTIRLDADGRVDHVQFGSAPEHESTPGAGVPPDPRQTAGA